MKGRESNLYPPLKTYLENKGYTVYGEVKNCDVAAVKNNELVIIEIKTLVSLKLVMQGVDRQKTGYPVYIAFGAKQKALTRARIRELRNFLKRLGLGLIAVYPDRKGDKVEILLNPISPPDPPGTNSKRRKELLDEIGGRYKDFNTGGSASSIEILTAYRLKALKLAVMLEKRGQSSPAELVKMGGPENTGDILGKNFYGWFERVNRGIYALSETGRDALKKFPDQIAYFRQIV